VPGRRPLRLGACDGHISPGLAAALQAEIDRLRAIPGLDDRAAEVTEFFAGIDPFLDEITQIRTAALVELHEERGYTYQRLAQLTDLARSRVGRICQLGRQQD
jgi:DNA-directed RNA polymerase specialized sigma24 family protein